VNENRESFKNIIKFFDDVASLVDDIFETDYESQIATSYFDPPTDLFETDTKLFMIVEIPGVNKDDLHIAIGPTMVLIQGVKRPHDQMRQGASFYKLEISYGVFRKRIYLPLRVKLNTVQVSLHNGLLTVEFTKDKKAMRLIEIA
jgi:HSP20 family protein